MDGTEPIADEELLFRRIPASQGWYDPQATPPLNPEAFRANANDTTGLSLYREKYKTIDEAARGREGKEYYVAVLKAGDLRAVGIDIAPRPLEGDPGHAEIPEMNYADRKTDRSRDCKVLLADRLCLRVEGPFKS
jgi:hypothetical protein